MTQCHLREGAPFALSAGVSVEGGAELSARTARIGAGESSSAPIVVSPAADGEAPSAPVAVAPTGGGAVRLSLAAAPEVPPELCGDVQDGQHPCFQGIRTAAGPALLLFNQPTTQKNASKIKALRIFGQNQGYIAGYANFA